MSAALIVQNKGGGHGELGFQLAQNLKANPAITSITILQDEACNFKKEPFASYESDLGTDVRIVQADLASDTMTASDVQSLLGDGQTYSYVWDNASKKPEGAAKAVCDCAASWGDLKLYTYVSSAGMYKPDEGAVFPMDEDATPIKESTGQNLFDKYCKDDLKMPYVSFRPQYIYGPKASKYDYIDWFFDRVVRGLPLPIPGDGTQIVSLTNSVDVASLLASPLNDEKTATDTTFFNCGTDDLISYNDLAKACAEVAGVDSVNIRYYDADKYGKGTFPFRMTDFYVAPDRVKAKLGWQGPQSKLKDDLKWYYEGYQARGGPTKDMDLSKDWEIIKDTDGADMSIYQKCDPAMK